MKINVLMLEFGAQDKTVSECSKAIRISLLKYFEKGIFNKDSKFLLVLPENFLFYPKSVAKLNEYYANGYIDKMLLELKNIAREFKVNIIAGSLPNKKDNRYFIECNCINETGDIVKVYQKKHLFKANVNEVCYDESEIYHPGISDVIYEIGDFKLGLGICFDLRFAEHFVKLRQSGANVLVLPAAFTKVTGKEVWEILLRARAIENQCFVIGVGLAGITSSGDFCYGNSISINPHGVILKSEDFVIDSCILKAVILDLTEVIETRQKLYMQY